MDNLKIECNNFYIFSTDHTKELFHEFGTLYYDKLNEAFICVPDSLFSKWEEINKNNDGQYIKLI